MEVLRRSPTLLERRLTAANKKIASQASEILDTQELTASLFEENGNLKNQLLDTQAIVATLAEGGTV